MGKVEVKKVPRQLNPYGDKLMKIWYDDNMPPKNYIWYKDEEYCYWNGQDWEPFELGTVESNNRHKHHKHGCDCDCCENIKFEKFKKEVLSAVLKLIKSQNPDSESALISRIQTLEGEVNSLKQINHNLFIKNTELESLLENLGYVKEEDIAGLDALTGLEERLNGFDDRISTNNRNVSNLNSRLASIESSVPSRLTALENAGYITQSSLNNYATQSYVNSAISNINVPTSMSELDNDMGFVSGVEVIYHEDEEPRIISNGDTVYLVDNVEYDREGQGVNKIYVSMMPHQISIETSDVEPYDDSSLQDRMGSLENRVETIEEDYISSEQEEVIAASLNDLNDRIVGLDTRVANLENEESGGDIPIPDDPDNPPVEENFVLTYDWNGGEEGPDDVYSPEITAIVSDVIPHMENYTFSHWEDPEGNIYHGGDSVILPITLTAQWEFDYPNEGTFMYMPAESESNPELISMDDSITYDQMVELLRHMNSYGELMTISSNDGIRADFYTEQRGDSEDDIGLYAEIRTSEESTEYVSAYIEQTESQGFKFVLDHPLMREIVDEETGEYTYYEEAEQTEISWSITQGE